MDDIALLRQAVDETTRVVDGIRPDQLGDPTPCEALLAFAGRTL